MGWLPFEEIARGEIDESLFAASLWDVHVGRAHERYRDPAKFFTRTYFTDELTRTLRSVSERLRGGEGAAVHMLLTGLGGGKTHTLIAIYHLARYGQRLPQVVLSELEKRGVKPPGPALVVVFDGSALDPRKMEEGWGTAALWGYIFKEIARAGYREFEELYEKYRGFDTAPGSEVLVEAFERVERDGKSLVILIDETANYIHNLGEDERRKMRIFLQALSRAVANLKRSLLVITFTSAKGAEEAVGEVQEVVRRVSKLTSIIRPEELPAVVKKTLLESVPPEEAEKAAEELDRDYRQHGGSFARRYPKDQLAQSYPIHPETVAVLGELAQRGYIQATRDSLRILAKTLHAMYNEGRNSAFLLPGDVPRQAVTNEILAREPGLRQAVENDFSRLAFMKIEGDCGRVAARIFTSLVLATVAYGRHVTAEEITTMAYSPDLRISPLIIPTCLNSHLVGNLEHIHVVETGEGNRYIVKAHAFWKTLLAKKKNEKLQRSEYYDELRRDVKRMARQIPSFKLYIWEEPPDRPDPTIVLADPRWQIKEIADRYGGRDRIYKGALLILAPHEGILKTILEKYAEEEAANELIRDAEHYGLTKEDLEAIRKHVDEVRREKTAKIREDLYSKIYYYTPRGLVSQEIHIILDDPATTRAKILEALKKDSKIAEEVSPDYIAAIVEQYQRSGREITFGELRDYFTGKSLEHPILLGGEERLKEVVKRAQKLVVVRRGQYVEDPPEIYEDDVIMTVDHAARRGLCTAVEGRCVKPQPTAEPPPRPPTPTPQHATRHVGTVRELVEALPPQGTVRIYVKKRAQGNDLQDAVDVAKALASVYARVENGSMELDATIKAENTTYKISTSNRNHAATAAENIKAILRGLSQYSPTLEVEIQYQGPAENLATMLKNPLIYERYREVKIEGRVEPIP